MKPFYGDKAKPRITVHTGGKTFSWVIDTGSAVSFMNKNSFKTAFGKKLQTNENHKLEILIDQ
jgi:hypothetical protein